MSLLESDSMNGLEPQLLSIPLVRRNFEATEDSITRVTSFEDRAWSLTLPRASRTDDLLGDWWKSELAGEVLAEPSQVALRSVDVFSGAGGLTLGLRNAAQSLGIDVQSRAALDVDEAGLRVHAAKHDTERLISRSVDLVVDAPVVGRHTEARFQYEPEVIEPALEELVGQVDVIVAGPPCQGHSSLNNQTRHNDDRNSLYLTVPALAVALQAPMVIIENVPGVVRDQSAVVQSAEYLLKSHGYRVSKGVISAHRLGWPQTRKRFFMIASRDFEPVPLLAQAKSMERSPLSLRWAIGDLVGSPDHPLLDGVPVYSQDNLDRMAYLQETEERNLPLDIRPLSHQGGTTYSAVYGRLAWDEPAPTITTGFSTPGRGRFTHPEKLRTLTAREAARLQGFSDGYFSPDVLEATRANRSLITKWIGDAVPAPLGELAALCLLAPSQVVR